MRPIYWVMEGKKRILVFATELFLKYGVRNVTMDDLAQQLGVSKKTIYASYRNKREIVMAVANEFFRMEKERSEQISKQSQNAIDELFRIVSWSLSVLGKISPDLVFETRKYYPEAWLVFDSFHKGYVLNKIRENLEQGILEGLYREGLHVEIVASLRILQIEATLHSDFFPASKFDPATVQVEVFELFMRGLVSDKGRLLLDQYLSSSPYSPNEISTHS